MDSVQEAEQMRAMVSYKGRSYLAEQDKRGRRDEADLVIYKASREIYRGSWRKLKSEDEMRRKAYKVLEAMDNADKDHHRI